jgi:hypothetical protein
MNEEWKLKDWVKIEIEIEDEDSGCSYSVLVFGSAKA